MDQARRKAQAMRVGVNVALKSYSGDYRQTGVSRYISELTQGLPLVKQPDDALIELGTRLGSIGSRALTRNLWEQTALPALAQMHRLDVLHGLVSTVPVLSGTATVVTIHDLAFLRYPSHVSTLRRAWLATAIRLSARTADRIITVSQQTADDLHAWLNVAEARICVVPLAATSRIRRLTGTELDVFRLKYGIDQPYVLAVGTLEPRKNVPMLLRAFAAIRDRIPHRLVLVGPEGWLTGGLRAEVAELKLADRLVMTGFVSDEELGGWYSAADLVAMPSLYEGFGLPVLEAMTCGAPVLASSASALPEVGGDAARYVDPRDETGWVEAIRTLLMDEPERERMRAAGIIRSRAFSWERTARATWEIFREVAG